MSCCEGFRLSGSPSEWSMRSKARIDALFEDSRSVCSSTFGGWCPSNLMNAPNVEEPETDEQQRKVNSAVQARIEAMFASVESENGTSDECAAAILPVKYMGAAPVGGRVASVRGLQEPLRQLLERIDECVIAELEVSRRGLTFRGAEISEKTNPFRRIAVWSALRLRRKMIPSGEIHHAFMPLVGEDCGSVSDEKHADLYRTMRSITKEATDYPPIFAVVMRRPGASRLLECHAFACHSEEDAIAAAATLYRALLADLETNRRRPRHSNGVGCVSLASVVSSDYIRDSVIDLTPSHQSFNNRCCSPPRFHSNGKQPVRPPRSKKSLASSPADEDRPYYIEKVPRRKKKMSEIRPEDVIEAKNRMSSCCESDQPEKPAEARLKKNKISSSKAEVNVISDDSIHQEIMANDECVIYGRLEDRKEDGGSSSSSQQNWAHQPRQDVIQIHTPGRSSEVQSLENSLYEKNIVVKNQENHFRNVDKIYSLGSEEINYNSRSRSTTRNQNREQKPGRASRTSTSREAESIYSNKGFNHPLLSGIQNLESANEAVPPRARRRSRAGSEPPVSRTQDAAYLIQEQNLKRSQSEYDVDKGDLLTRVELPRRGSFLTQGTKKRTIAMKDGTPLGFTELFDEFRNQEGLTSVDDILAAIIDPEGMSFNDLKPLYKEFLLKLASTLTQDELYQRSANIMRRRRRPQRRRSARRPCLLGRAIKRSVSRLKSGPTEFTSVIFSARRLNESFDRSSSSCDVRNNNRNRVLSSRLDRRRPSRRNKHAIGQTTSEDSDTCRRMARSAAANRSSSGYVSCSECSYDSESCTCVSADKCYCSLSRRVSAPVVPGPTVVCACDTDSCSESNKCYCPRKPTVHPSIMEQLRQSGIMPRDNSMSRCSINNKSKSKSQRTNKQCATSSKSMEYLKGRPLSVRSSVDNLALDYDLFRPEKQAQLIEDKILVISARDPQGRLVYVGGADRNKKASKNCPVRNSGHHEALSIKKSAEIAAVFGSRSNRPCRRVNSGSSLRSSVSLEAGLGYLP